MSCFVAVNSNTVQLVS